MSSIICDTKEEAMRQKRYLKKQHKSNIIFHESEYDNEVVYTIPFPKCIDAGRI